MLHLCRPDTFRRWILIMTGSWWPFSSEEMTCVSTATTEWVAARRRCGEFAIIRQIKDVFHKRQPPHNGTVARKYSIPSCCATPGVQSRLMISLFKWDRSLELNNKALWPALPPLIVILCRSWMRHARPSMSTFCPPSPSLPICYLSLGLLWTSTWGTVPGLVLEEA